ncbi:Lar family restriction alleviation protein [Croceibacterium aestuarii]|uniref:Lar family restriction alleviation protein n=1 Tax=Croceibacterium aestuarii TaxID=3064139 RepID=UPI00272E4528|nr:Lar family restriction alleviation protein [Croceibacterium sp. D39]
MTKDEQLAACPFCSGAAELRSWDWPYERHQVRCSKCKAHARARMAVKAEAIAAWNQRQPASDEVLREALRAVKGAAYSVAPEINSRGYNWSEAYLDQALPLVTEALAHIDARLASAPDDGLVERVRRVVQHIERYEGQETFTIAAWQLAELDALAALGSKTDGTE